MVMIKYFIVGMVQIPKTFVMMDVVIANVPPSYGMLLSIHWGTSLGVSIQFDLSHATIPVFREGLTDYTGNPK